VKHAARPLTWLVSALNDRFYHLERLHGAEGARLTELGAALLACDVDSAKVLGKLLARLRDVAVDGRVLRRDGRHGGVRRWHVEHVQCLGTSGSML
jgi:hypothetical protein